MFQLIAACLVCDTVTNILVKMCFIRREMRHKYKAYSHLAMPKDLPSDLGDGSESLIQFVEVP